MGLGCRDEDGGGLQADLDRKRQPAWEQVTVGALGRDKIERLQVDGGWLYRNASCAEGGMTFVPFPPAARVPGTTGTLLGHPAATGEWPLSAQGPHGV